MLRDSIDRRKVVLFDASREGDQYKLFWVSGEQGEKGFIVDEDCVYKFLETETINRQTMYASVLLVGQIYENICKTIDVENIGRDSCLVKFLTNQEMREIVRVPEACNLVDSITALMSPTILDSIVNREEPAVADLLQDPYMGRFK